MGLQRLSLVARIGILLVCLPLGTAFGWQQDWGQAVVPQVEARDPSVPAWGYDAQSWNDPSFRSGAMANQASRPPSQWPGPNYDQPVSPQYGGSAPDSPAYGYGATPAQPTYWASPPTASAGSGREYFDTAYPGNPASAGAGYSQGPDFPAYSSVGQPQPPVHRFRPWPEQPTVPGASGYADAYSRDSAVRPARRAERSRGYREQVSPLAGRTYGEARSQRHAAVDAGRTGAGALLWYAPGADAPTRFRFRPLDDGEQALGSRFDPGGAAFAAPAETAQPAARDPGFNGVYPSVGFEGTGYATPQHDPFRPWSSP